jgi:uncharacterized membrane protein
MSDIAPAIGIDMTTRLPFRFTWRLAGLGFVFVWFFLGGVGHFLMTDTFTSVTPAYVPMPRAVVLATGVCEIAGALALCYPPLRWSAGLALILLTICVTPVHIEMLRHADHYRTLGVPVLWGRLLFQPVFAAIIWGSTRPPRRPIRPSAALRS